MHINIFKRKVDAASQLKHIRLCIFLTAYMQFLTWIRINNMWNIRVICNVNPFCLSPIHLVSWNSAQTCNGKHTSAHKLGTWCVTSPTFIINFRNEALWLHENPESISHKQMRKDWCKHHHLDMILVCKIGPKNCRSIQSMNYWSQSYVVARYTSAYIDLQWFSEWPDSSFQGG